MSHYCIARRLQVAMLVADAHPPEAICLGFSTKSRGFEKVQELVEVRFGLSSKARLVSLGLTNTSRHVA